jgi:outer membrane protein assembly factor BamB
MITARVAAVRSLSVVTLLALLVVAVSCGGQGAVSTSTGAPPTGPVGDWPTYHHDPARTGASSDQEALGSVTKVWTSAELDGELIYAQPLVVGDRVLVATEGNSVFALDASSGAIVWKQNLGAPTSAGYLPGGNIDPSGITGTPVVDVSSGTLFVVAFLKAGPNHELFALDLATGAIRWHRTVDPPGLSPLVEQQRGALALTGGRVYVAFGGLYGDIGEYKGAVVSASTDGSGELTSYVVPTSRMAGIWNPSGPVVASDGDLWVVTGNSESQGSFDFGNAVVRLSPELSVLDYFAPEDWAALNAGDLDLSSLGPVLLPGGRVLAIAKTGTAYLLDAAKLGHVGKALATTDIGSSPFGSAAVMGSRVFVPTTKDLVALDVAADGLQVAWKVSGGTGSPIVAAGHVWSLGYDGKLKAVDPDNGSVVFTLPLSRPASRFITPSAAGGRLFVADGGKVVAVGLR